MPYLDLRTLVDEWEDNLNEILLLTEHEDPDSDAIASELEDENEKYEALCRELGIDETADALKAYADDEPTLIPEDEFEGYAQDFAEEVGLVPESAPWPLNCIDWESAADELREDFTSVTYDDDDYLIRTV